MPASSRVAALPFAWVERARERFLRRTPSDGPAVTLAHARIYIVPSRRGLAVIGALATMLVASLNYGLALGLVVTFLLTGLVSAALLHTFRNLAGLTLRPSGAGETFAGARIAFTLGLDPGGRDRVAIELAPRGSAAKVVDVAFDAVPAITLEVDAPRRGRDGHEPRVASRARDALRPTPVPAASEPAVVISMPPVAPAFSKSDTIRSRRPSACSSSSQNRKPGLPMGQVPSPWP